MALSVLILLALVAAATSADYCSLPTCTRGPHTRCLFPTEGPAATCSQPRERVISADDQIAIVNAHNAIRRGIKAGHYESNGLPPAAVMPDLTWDDQLAATAQRWTDQCVFGHDKCRDEPGIRVGQNAAWTWGSGKDWDGKAVGQWFFKELPNFKQKDLTFVGVKDPVSKKSIGHLTQVIWAATSRVGCGYIVTDDGGRMKRSYYCNYAPAGNMRGAQIYTED